MKSRTRVLNPTNILAFLFQEERRSGVLLVCAAVAALVLANSSLSHLYFDFINKQLSLGAITLDIQHWVSEGLMALFFLVVTLEVKREFVDGELHTWKKASFPVIAAIGGMAAPALIYLFINQSQPESAGWAIPIATDIAIATGVLALLGNRIPKKLRIFLLALAIIDDIGSIVIIGLFYNHPTNATALIFAIFFGLLLLLLRKQKYWIPIFVLLGFCLWYCLTLAGVSGTMAGVIVAAFAPLTTSGSESMSLQSSEKFEDVLLPITAYFIVPLFVFCSAGLVFSSLSISEGNGLSVFIGVAAGLLIGKPLGIFVTSWLASVLRLTTKPKGLSWTHIIGVGFIAGMGFTISLLITDLSFDAYNQLQNMAIFGVFVASILAGLIGLLILGLNSNRNQHS